MKDSRRGKLALVATGLRRRIDAFDLSSYWFFAFSFVSAICLGTVKLSAFVLTVDLAELGGLCESLLKAIGVRPLLTTRTPSTILLHLASVDVFVGRQKYISDIRSFNVFFTVDCKRLAY